MERFITRPSSNPLYEEESLEAYFYGNFHPVCLGDKFKDGRYTVVHKLGFGGFSTVWLVRDTQDNKWAALKIVEANSTANGAASREVTNLQALERNENAYIPTFHEHFFHEHFFHDGPNGSHLCIITDLLGLSLRHVVTSYYNLGDSLEPDDILRLSGQLLEATALLHEAGFAHGGMHHFSHVFNACQGDDMDSDHLARQDLSAVNIVFTAYNLVSLSKEALLDVIGQPETAELLNADGSKPGSPLPKHLVGTARWYGWTDEFDEDLCLLDFGESFRLEAAPDNVYQPSDLRVPETVFGDKLDHRVDLWQGWAVS